MAVLLPVTSAAHPPLCQYTDLVVMLPTSPAPVLQIQMLVELRGMALEQQGKMSRYSPLVVVELVK
jgi:hypothetical protein